MHCVNIKRILFKHNIQVNDNDNDLTVIHIIFIVPSVMTIV